MKAAAFDYKRARSLDEAVDLLAAAAGDGKVLAGGQSLGPMLNLRLARPQFLVDIKRADGFRRLAADTKVLSIGAGWTHAEIEDGAIEDPSGLLRSVGRGIAYRAVRNRGTIGGSLAHADPAADWVSTLAALGAVVVTRCADGRTARHPAATFVTGAFVTRLGQAEVIAAIEIPRLSATARWGYYKICRKAGEFANAIGVAILDPATGVERVLAGATTGAPILLPRTAARLAEAGPVAAAESIDDEIRAALPNLPPAMQDLHIIAVRRALSTLASNGGA